ncbi:MAG: hypothetical protein Q8N53_17355 [Longimicrobiales bacterium]|nr:hypothetical protein [Longimicrobiales bacterium]
MSRALRLLGAAYAVRPLEAVERGLAQEDRSLHALFRDLGGAVIPAEELGAGPAAFLNVNTPEDRVRAEAALVARRLSDADVVGAESKARLTEAERSAG